MVGAMGLLSGLSCFTWNMEASVAGKKMIQLLNILMHVTISWRFGKASCMACWNQGNIFGCIWKLDCVFFPADQALLVS